MGLSSSSMGEHPSLPLDRQGASGHPEGSAAWLLRFALDGLIGLQGLFDSAEQFAFSRPVATGWDPERPRWRYFPGAVISRPPWRGPETGVPGASHDVG